MFRNVMSTLVLGFLLGSLLAGCTSSNPWREGFVAVSGNVQPIAEVTPEQVRAVSLQLVEFEQAAATDAMEQPGAIGYSNFTGVMTSARERELRQFAAEIGAEHVAWGLRLLHVERDSSLQPVTEWSDTSFRGRAFNPDTGRYDGPKVRGDYSTSTTTYIPVADDKAYYAFRAIFFGAK